MNIAIVLRMYCKTQIVVDHHLPKYDNKNSIILLILMQGRSWVSKAEGA